MEKTRVVLKTAEVVLNNEHALRTQLCPTDMSSATRAH